MDFDDIDFENRIVDPEELPDEFGDTENPLRPKILMNISGRKRLRKIFQYIYRRQCKGTKLLIMYCYTVRRDWVKQPLQV